MASKSSPFVGLAIVIACLAVVSPAKGQSPLFYGTSSATQTSNTVQRVNTNGGLAQGPCDKRDSFLSVPYHADYVFLRSAD